ncbi:chromate transporter [Peptoniphilus sp. oral taxon 386]|uniref:chromate transporter n=1 Tax=Peptoniphilus sp. oral taxon 386 TaxID=652713 RepID=UPI0002D64D33|nr:chromate transporter [Peptoniphilus sp. oral taxon 386]
MDNLIVQLYFTFLKIGTLAFGGGYASIPLIERYIVNENNWISKMEFRDLVSISQMTPGPIAINSATFVGQKVGGVLGSVVATAAIVTPQFLLMMFLGHFLFKKNKKFKVLEWMLNGIRAGLASLIFMSALKLIHTSMFPNGFSNVKISAIITFIIGFILYYRKVDMLKLIAIGAILGIVLEAGFIFI